MFYELLAALVLGCLAGIFTGLIPGVHVNLVSLLLLSMSGYFLGFTTPIVLCVFIVALSVTHTFLDSIPSIFLGAPDADQALNVLPGHRMLMQGKGFEAVKLTVVGSLISLIIIISIIPVMIPLIGWIYPIISPHIGWILMGIMIFMILKEGGVRGKFWSFYIFMISGILGIIVFSIPNFEQPLLPLLSGMFGISTLLVSLNSESKIPEQKITDDIKVPKKNMIKAFGASVFSGSLVGMFPGLGSAQAAVIGSQLTGKICMHSFMILVGGINTVNFVFSLVTLLVLDKARNGAIVVVREIISVLSVNGLIALLAAALAAGGIATFLTFGITRIFCRIMGKVNYKIMCICVISFIALMVLYFSGWMGMSVLLISTAIGIIPVVAGVVRSNAMGCLILPVILYFIL
jgi:putative membrane protein